MILLIILLVVILVAVVGTSYATMRDELNQSTRSIMEIYGSNLDYQIDKMENLLLNLVYNNNYLSLLGSDDESTRYYASIELRNELNNLLLEDAGADMVVLADQTYDTTLDISGQHLTLEEKSDLREFTKGFFDRAYGNDWAFADLSGEVYLYRFVRSGSWTAAIYLSADNWMNAFTGAVDGISFVVADADGNVWGLQGDPFFDWQEGMDVDEIPTAGHTVDQYSLGHGGIVLYSYANSGNIWSQLRIGMILVIAVIMIMVLFMIITITTLRRQVMAPMDDMIQNMEKIRNGDENARLETTYRYREFDSFKDTFNQLMDEIMGLKISSYEKQILLSETELRCIRLQIRPHFFLNAMTTISSLSMQQKNEEIQRYIEALSKNVRYMFRAGLHTVPLKEEIQHVENYFNMQDLKYPGAVFYFIDMPEELGDWPIPQMIIHTIIENEYKYAVSVESLLTILIRIGTTTEGAEELLTIDIEDDGAGYPEDVLKNMSGEGSNMTKNGDRVGLQSIRDMLAIMYERDDLFTISNVSPHGCLNHILIPKKALHVVVEDDEDMVIT